VPSTGDTIIAVRISLGGENWSHKKTADYDSPTDESAERISKRSKGARGTRIDSKSQLSSFTLTGQYGATEGRKEMSRGQRVGERRRGR